MYFAKIIGVTSTYKTFSIDFSFIVNKKDESYKVGVIVSKVDTRKVHATSCYSDAQRVGICECMPTSFPVCH